MNKRILTCLNLGFLALLAVQISACSNTANGFGKDMERAGQNIQNSF